MTIKCYDRVYWHGDPFIDFRRNLCYCSGNECGATIKKPHTTGYTIYLWRYALRIEFAKPKNCDSPF